MKAEATVRSHPGGAMLTAADYLAITPSAARQQWLSISGRSQPSGGRRQVDFVPVETLTCLAASLVVDHRRYGGSTSHKAEEPVPRLAQLFKRPNSSVLAKMANLDGSRSNGARHEVEVAARLLTDESELADIYRLVFQAARDVGITAAALPDFLYLENDQGPVTFLGQDEITPSEIAGVVRHGLANTLDELTEKMRTATIRVGQHRFARGVLRNHEHQCVFCGLAVAFEGRRTPRLLLASHIKPWRDCDSRERLDIANGLTACPTHDVAFDTGLITITPDLRIQVRPDLEHAAATNPGVGAAFGRPPLAEHLRLPAGALPPQPSYLEWHRTRIYGGDSR
ncbi:HNH endonuclease [Actinoplanes philippinensis]|uniref:HNH endonuclease n=1 Tax=Actinoplanes philippinensis TaxID=35752 RepID=UPI0033CF8AD0